MKKILSIMLVFLAILILTGCDSADYDKAMELLESGNYLEAKAIFVELGDYKDSSDKIKVCENAYQYEQASIAYTAGNYKSAISQYRKLGDYKDSVSQIKQCYVALHGEDAYNLIMSLEIGDTVEYGTFEQDHDGTTTDEKILWHVIDKQGESVLLLSDKILWYDYFSDEFVFSKSFTYTESRFNNWLNNSFYNVAFTDEEKQLILENNPSYAGKVFLLSKEEAEKLSRSILKCTDTQHARKEARKNNVKPHESIWALRTLFTTYKAWDAGIVNYLTVTERGRIFEGNDNDFKAGESGFPCGNPDSYTGIRPAIWISLNS